MVQVIGSNTVVSSVGKTARGKYGTEDLEIKETTVCNIFTFEPARLSKYGETISAPAILWTATRQNTAALRTILSL